MKRAIMTGLILIGVIGMTGCHWVGRTAGKTQAKIERKVNSVEQGYNEGYSQEKSKSAPKQ